MSNNSTIRDTFLSNKQPEINYQETDNNIIHFSNENMNDYVSSSPGIYINKEVAYDRFYNKGRKTKKQKLIIGQNFRKLKVKERDQKRKKMIKNKQIENLYFSPEEQQVALAEHTAKQNHEIHIIQPQKKRLIRKLAQIEQEKKAMKELSENVNFIRSAGSKSREFILKSGFSEDDVKKEFIRFLDSIAQGKVQT